MIKSAVKPEESNVFVCYLESVSGKLSEYSVEILEDNILIKSSKGKIKLQFNVNTITPFAGGE